MRYITMTVPRNGIRRVVTWAVLVHIICQYCRAACPSTTDGNPQILDSSGDNCYILVDTLLSWQEADNFCKDQYSGALTQITNDVQLDLVSNFVSSNDGSTIWIGGREFYTNWKWMDHTNTDSFNLWPSAEYQYYVPPFTCAVIDPGSNNMWKKQSCSLQSEFICEIESSNSNCAVLGTERTPIVDGNRCFLLVQNQFKSWFEARQYCNDLGGVIASVNSQTSHDLILPELPDGDSVWRRFWIGLRQSQFYWSTGEVLNSYYWGPRQPSGSAACIRMKYYDDGRRDVWQMATCDTQVAFVCQIGTSTATRLGIPTLIPPTTTTSTTTTTTTTTTAIPTTINQGGNTGSDAPVTPGPTEPAPATIPVRPDIVATQQSPGPNPGITAGLVVVILVIFGVLTSLLIFFYYYTRRNKLIKKKARSDAVTRNNEPNFDNPEIKNNENGDVERGGGAPSPINIFTTSFTNSTSTPSKQRMYNVTPQQESSSADNKSATPNGDVQGQKASNSRASSTTSLQTSDGGYHVPVDNPESGDPTGIGMTVANQQQKAAPIAEKNQRKTDSEGTSGTDDGGSSSNKTSKHKFNDTVRTSKRKQLGERGSRVRRSSSRVAPVDSTNNKDDDADGTLTNSNLQLSSTTGSFRRSNSQESFRGGGQTLPVDFGGRGMSDNGGGVLGGSLRGGHKRGNALPPMERTELQNKDRDGPVAKPRSKRQKDVETTDDENDSARRQNRKYREKRSKSRDNNMSNNEDAVHPDVIPISALGQRTSDDIPSDIVRSHRGSSRRARVPKTNNKETNTGKKYSSSSRSRTPESDRNKHESNRKTSPTSDDSQNSRNKRHGESNERYNDKKQSLTNGDGEIYSKTSNKDHKDNSINTNDYNDNNDYEDYDLGAKKVIDHNQTLYLQTCNSMDNLSDDGEHNELESLPDDESIDNKQDIFV